MKTKKPTSLVAVVYKWRMIGKMMSRSVKGRCLVVGTDTNQRQENTKPTSLLRRFLEVPSFYRFFLFCFRFCFRLWLLFLFSFPFPFPILVLLLFLFSGPLFSLLGKWRRKANVCQCSGLMYLRQGAGADGLVGLESGVEAM